MLFRSLELKAIRESVKGKGVVMTRVSSLKFLNDSPASVPHLGLLEQEKSRERYLNLCYMLNCATTHEYKKYVEITIRNTC